MFLPGGNNDRRGSTSFAAALIVLLRLPLSLAGKRYYKKAVPAAPLISSYCELSKA
jgi:hypothetical protein